MKRLFTTLLITLSLTCLIRAQVTNVPYHCDFENASDIADWELATAYGIDMSYMVGEATASHGTHSLYVSPINGPGHGNAVFIRENSGYIISAIKRFQLPAGDYDISFDYNIKGGVGDSLFVLWLPENRLPLLHAQANNMIAANSIYRNANYVKGIYTKAFDWSNDQKILTITNSQASQNMCLMFAFVSASGNAPVQNPGACIDNIDIVRKGNVGDCYMKPMNLMQENTQQGNCRFSWTGYADSYELEYFKMTEPNNVTHVNNITNSYYDVPQITLTEGVYAFRVRATCENDTSLWVTRQNMLVYDASGHCIDYLNLSGPDVVCQYGDFDNPYRSIGVIDNGSTSILSRHTIHFKENEFDPNTGGGLRTKPQGAIASVRLGNWETGSEAEAITYRIERDEDTRVIKMNYAVVLQDPSHDPSQQPHFTLEILDAAGNRIDPNCGVADFAADSHMPGWHTYSSGYDQVTWKDWTTIALNLTGMPDVIYVRLTTRDCSQSGHYGYAYFTLDCTDGKMKGDQSCGVIPDKFEVDEGFSYRWYKKSEGMTHAIPATDPRLSMGGRVFTPAVSDTAVYCVDMMQTNNSNCYYTLESSRKAVLPEADVKAYWEPVNCQNKVRLVNTSRMIEYYNDADGNLVRDTLPTFNGLTLWTIHRADGTVMRSEDLEEMILDVPEEGERISVHMYTRMIDADCSDELDTTFVIGPIGPTSATTVKYMCDGDAGFDFNGQHYDQTGTYTTVLKTWAGCDSTLTFDLTVIETETIPSDTMVCDKDVRLPWTWFGQEIDPTKEDSIYEHHVEVSFGGCDTLVYTNHVRILSSLVMTLDYERMDYCQQGLAAINIPYTVQKGVATAYHLMFDKASLDAGFHNVDGDVEDEAEVSIPLDVDVLPGTYSARIKFDNAACGDTIFNIDFDVPYAADSVITQRWGDFLALRQRAVDKYGEFTTIQWYHNGTPISGQNGAQLYLPNAGIQPQIGDAFSLELTRKKDGITKTSCEFTLKDFAGYDLVSVSPTVVINGEAFITGAAAEPMQVRIINQMGSIVSTQIAAGANARISIPQSAGIYMVEITRHDGQRILKKIIVK
ncbi:MAG TPA: hypothetical protein DEO38_00295 [Bacteroidales bacterium]|nr:hypothetical protein [Bacteroidales bacterium]